MTNYARYEGPTWKPRVSSDRPGTGNAVPWFLLGVGIGAAAALLLTPANGREVRNAVGRGYRRTVDGISRGTRELRQRGSNLLSFTRSKKAAQYQQG